MTTVRITKGDLHLERVERVPSGAKVVQKGPVELSRRLIGEGRNDKRIATWELDGARLHKLGDELFLEVLAYAPVLASGEYGTVTLARGVWTVGFRKPPARRS